MTMRSIPPASSHFAERPVPAPPPTIGSPRAIMPRNFSRMALRAIRGIALLPTPLARDLQEVFNQRLGKCGVVDVAGQPHQAAARCLAHGGIQCPEQRGIGGGIVEGAAGLVEQRHAALWN